MYTGVITGQTCAPVCMKKVFAFPLFIITEIDIKNRSQCSGPEMPANPSDTQQSFSNKHL